MGEGMVLYQYKYQSLNIQSQLSYENCNFSGTFLYEDLAVFFSFQNLELTQFTVFTVRVHTQRYPFQYFWICPWHHVMRAKDSYLHFL